MDKNGQTERPSHNEIISIGQKLTKKALARAKAFIITVRLLVDNTNYYWQLAGKRLGSISVTVPAVPPTVEPEQVHVAI